MKIINGSMILSIAVMFIGVARGEDPLFQSYTLEERGGVSNAEVPSKGMETNLDGFVYIYAGKFVMGSPEDEIDRRDDEVLHEVYLPQPYYISNQINLSPLVIYPAAEFMTPNQFLPFGFYCMNVGED